MSSRGYTLVEVAVGDRLWPEVDRIVRVIEYVQRNLRAIAPDVPQGCEVDLLAAGTAHNAGPRPVLGIHEPPAPPNGAPVMRPGDAWFASVQRRVDAWCEGQTDDSLREIAATTPAPTWAELRAVGVHPRRG